MPGWIDTHVHINWHFNAEHKYVGGREDPKDAALYTAENAWLTLQGGFTTVQSVGAPIDGVVRDRIAQGSLTRAADADVGAADSDHGGRPGGAARTGAETKPDGADVIKLFATAGMGAGGEQTDR